ncbi:unnamed protein product [Paramecium octaurelia]|uniref:Uncharacterized protein n=1 Tax=Paramecium octaurelia TaxID=43137 RepID=A0A8S1SHZ5_PAROT|nr:unnamed protein product [Paramecium octaurelia]
MEDSFFDHIEIVNPIVNTQNSNAQCVRRCLDQQFQSCIQKVQKNISSLKRQESFHTSNFFLQNIIHQPKLNPKQLDKSKSFINALKILKKNNDSYQSNLRQKTLTSYQTSDLVQLLKCRSGNKNSANCQTQIYKKQQIQAKQLQQIKQQLNEFNIRKSNSAYIQAIFK